MKRLVHEVFGQALDPILLGGGRTGNEDGTGKGGFAAAYIDVRGGRKQHVQGATRSGNGSLKRADHSDEVERLRQHLREPHVTNLLPSGEPKPRIAPSPRWRVGQQFHVQARVGHRRDNRDRMQHRRLRSVEMPGSRVGPPHGRIVMHPAPQSRRRQPVPPAGSPDELSGFHYGSGWNENTIVKRSPA